MSKDRFFQLRNNLHFVNNLEKPDNCKDVFFKVRPLYDSIRKRYLELPLPEILCVDEQMIPFTGSLSVKQYIKSKPNPWGVKCYLLCGKNGMAYDIILYQESTTELDPAISKKFGLAASVVLKLIENVKTPGHCLFFDNYFGSYHLLQVLKEKNIFAACTARINRFQNPPLLSEKQIKKEARGYSQEIFSEDGDIVLVK